jgi:hypothetical protein
LEHDLEQRRKTTQTRSVGQPSHQVETLGY